MKSAHTEVTEKTPSSAKMPMICEGEVITCSGPVVGKLDELVTKMEISCESKTIEMNNSYTNNTAR